MPHGTVEYANSLPHRDRPEAVMQRAREGAARIEQRKRLAGAETRTGEGTSPEALSAAESMRAAARARGLEV